MSNESLMESQNADLNVGIVSGLRDLKTSFQRLVHKSNYLQICLKNK
jgi:hypothetical protein